MPITNWTPITKNSTNYTPISKTSTNYTPITKTSTGYTPGNDNVSAGIFLLQNGDYLLLQNSNNLALQ